MTYRILCTLRTLKSLSLTFILLPVFFSSFVMADTDYSSRKDVQDFAREFAKEHNKSYDEVMATLSQGVYKQSIIDAISKPAERVLTWGDYRNIFLEEKRLNSGVEFWHEHRD